jgi:hypothetical protein
VDAPTFDPLQDERVEMVDAGTALTPLYKSKMSLISQTTMESYLEEYQTCEAFVDDNLRFPEVRE